MIKCRRQIPPHNLKAPSVPSREHLTLVAGGVNMEWKRLGLEPITRVSASGLRGREGARHSPKHSE